MRRIFFILTILIASSCSNQEKEKRTGDAASKGQGWDVTVSGKVKFPNSRQVSIEELTPADNAKRDSTTMAADGSYSKTLHLTEPGYYRFTFSNLQAVDLVLDKSNVELNVDGNNQEGALEIKGSPDYDLLADVQKLLQEFQSGKQVADIEAQYRKAGETNNQALVASLKEQYLELHTANNDKIVKDLESRPVNLGMINLLQSSMFEDKDRYYPFYKTTAEKALALAPNSVHIKQFADMVTKMGITAIGQKAPEISLPDPSGKIVKLSSFKGRYVLVDFWAKWCGPCRAENPNVVKAYNKFKNMGFEILGVSLDRSKEDWLAAIQQDGLTWTHVSDLKYFESQAALDYNITGIPFSVLVDPNGVIIAKSLRGRALEKKLAEVYKK